MAYLIGAVVGGLVGMLLLSRIALWALKGLGDSPRRVLIAHFAAYVVAVIVGGLGYADGGPPRFGYAAAVYILPSIIWLAVDLLALKGRLAKARTAP